MTITVDFAKVFEWVGLFICVGIPALVFAVGMAIKTGGDARIK
jgi:hypothetical protein